MKIVLKNNLENLSLPLPIYKTVYIADVVSKDGEDFSILVGLDEKLIAQLKKFSLDENDIELQKNTGDKNRFGVGSYKDWYKRNRTPFALMHSDTGALAAIVWFGPEILFDDKNDWHTVGWRSYAPFRGKGLIKDFSNFAIDFYLEHFSNINLWAAIKKENTGSQELAAYLGFKILKEKSNDVSVVMIR